MDDGVSGVLAAILGLSTSILVLLALCFLNWVYGRNRGGD